jgi:iron complex outermembrane receptor protein
VTVTATRGKERETPVTLSTLEYQGLNERYAAQDIPALLSELPSTTFYSESGNNLGYTYLNIRGFDSRRIAVMVNGIPQNDPEDHNVYWLDMPDLPANLEDVQVQRGAGSAFYGPPAIGGSVNLVTRKFAGERSVSLSAGAGSFNTRRYSAAYSSGLFGGHYAVHGRFSKILSDGYRDRAWVDFTSYFLGLARYDESMSTELHVYGGPISDGLAYYGIPKEDVRDPQKRRANPIQRPEEQEKFHQPHVELLHEWRVSPTITVNNSFFYVYGDGFFDYDGSWAPYSYYRITPPSGDPDTMFIPGAMIRAQVTNRQWGWLPRVTLSYGFGTLILGAELRSHHSLHWGALKQADQLVPGLPADYRYYQYRGAKQMVSLYAHALADLTPALKLMLDLQYAFNRYHLYDEMFLGNDFSVPYHFVNPRAGINVNVNDRWSAYATAAVTSREPRLKNLYDAAEASTPAAWGSVVPQFAVRPDGSIDFSSPLVKAESLLDLELGVRYVSGTTKATLNGYWMDFSDEIVKSGQVDRFGQPVTGNAERTRHVGLELSVSAEPAAGLELLGNLTACRNRFVRHTDYSTGAPLPLDGNPIAGFPDLLANGRVTYRVGGLSLSGSVRFVGRQYTDNFRDQKNTVDPFVVCDGWIGHGFTGGLLGETRLDARLHVTNIFNALYASYGEGSMFFVGAERSVYFGIELAL